ncbi:small cysteine-rich outer membrane protein [Chlamydiifrater phoenicopteri]|uniref:small cysteine-rich outer membrane protein n=1 Tax=Chlamydiifrater phoenicopteri TaxID=2681469 RepID=UPI001BCEDE08
MKKVILFSALVASVFGLSSCCRIIDCCFEDPCMSCNPCEEKKERNGGPCNLLPSCSKPSCSKGCESKEKPSPKGCNNSNKCHAQ